MLIGGVSCCQPVGEGTGSVGTVTVTETTGVATGTVVGVVTGRAGSKAATLSTVSVAGLGSAETTGDFCVVGAAAARGVSAG